ncbi:MAG: Gfo/Idh/MocA family oxidoreductase [Phycisphaerae bacterium]|nr:Gfo/Idh/MocA family oxidoreductase [Phycisphaerae bacterium]
MSRRIWNFGIVGAGLIADFHARAIRELPNARLLGLFDNTPEKAEQLAIKFRAKAFDSLEAMLADPGIDIVTIATPSGAHAEPAIAAARAGKHVLCEKPLEITLDRIDEMIAAHHAAGTMLGGIFQNRFNPAMEPLRRAVAEERFGRITYAGVFVPWWRTDEYYSGSWHGTLAMDGGGALMNQSIHMIDMLLDIVGPVRRVSAFAGTLGHTIEAEDTAVAVVEFAHGALGQIFGTTASWPGRFKQFEMTGTRGTVVYVEDSFTEWRFADERAEDAVIRTRFGQVQSNGGGVADPAAIGHHNHARNFAAFVEAVEKGQPFEIDASQARKAVELILAIYKSAREGKTLTLA